MQSCSQEQKERDTTGQDVHGSTNWFLRVHTSDRAEHPDCHQSSFPAPSACTVLGLTLFVSRPMASGDAEITPSPLAWNWGISVSRDWSASV
eukprot:1139104-Pelagomonas_calceolata.AAC.6